MNTLHPIECEMRVSKYYSPLFMNPSARMLKHHAPLMIRDKAVRLIATSVRAQQEVVPSDDFPRTMVSLFSSYITKLRATAWEARQNVHESNDGLNLEAVLYTD